MKRLTVALVLLLAVIAASLTLGSGATATAAPAPSSSSSSSSSSSWGRTVSTDHELKNGCHDYLFRYQVSAPTSEWMAEIKLINPRGRSIATRTYTSEGDPTHGARTWDICSSTTRQGVHEIKMMVTAYDQYGNTTVRHMKPTTFRFKGVR